MVGVGVWGEVGMVRVLVELGLVVDVLLRVTVRFWVVELLERVLVKFIRRG